MLSKAITSSFLALIPKKKIPLGLIDYLPIFLVGSLYKVLYTLLSVRLKKVIGFIMSPNQTAIIPGRQFIDGALVANEVGDYAMKENKVCLLFKVDFKKTYDKVSWDFLRFMMHGMGFGDKWMRWMEANIFTSHMSVFVNGSPTKEFVMERGLRQRDPLSHFFVSSCCRRAGGFG